MVLKASQPLFSGTVPCRPVRRTLVHRLAIAASLCTVEEKEGLFPRQPEFCHIKGGQGGRLLISARDRSLAGCRASSCDSWQHESETILLSCFCNVKGTAQHGGWMYLVPAAGAPLLRSGGAWLPS